MSTCQQWKLITMEKNNAAAGWEVTAGDA